MKELWIAAHDELIEEYLEEHPDATEAEASEATADVAHDRLCDNLAAIGDAARERAKYGDA